MKLKPWYKVITPREDLCEGKPLDASEFAVHLDQVRDNKAPEIYRNPERFFHHTYLTENLKSLAAEVVRRLNGIKTETSAVFNMTTQFGGGKTHALTLLYHLANHGPDSLRWVGVKDILTKAGVSSIPQSAIATFVGTEFDAIQGRGGADGTPLRKTPWGEIAFQLGGEESYRIVEQHDKDHIEPKGDVIRAFLPKDRPVLILLDEIINYVSTYRKRGYHNTLYNFIQSLSETARGLDNVVLLISIPASELSYTDMDETDQQRFKNMLDRLGKAYIMSAEKEISEIIRRRLFEWDEIVYSQNGSALLPRDAENTCNEYADWLRDHAAQIPSWFSMDNAREIFRSTYPFHPTTLSVFERKWQTLPRFQQTRGVLRILALWISQSYQEGFKGNHSDPLIALGTAPFDNSLFRSALFEQLGEPRLEGAVTTDICGGKNSHAVRLDKEAVDTIKKSRLHRKVATAIFFESNGGQTRSETTIPEIRLGVGEPGFDIGNIETVVENLTESCYFLIVEKNSYHFSLKENLNKRFSDRKANINPADIDQRVRETIKTVFMKGNGVECLFFPKESNQVPDRPVLTFVVLDPKNSVQNDVNLPAFLEKITRECGSSARSFKNALVWCTPEDSIQINEEARRLLAWETIAEELGTLRLDEAQKHQIISSKKKSEKDLEECVWRTYKRVYLLGKDNRLKERDFGLTHSSSSSSISKFIVNQITQFGDVTESIGPGQLTKNWPGFDEWSIKSIRDAVFASPLFPRLLNPNSIKSTIAKGVRDGFLAYVAKSENQYEPFYYKVDISPDEIEISDEMFAIKKESAEIYLKRKDNPEVKTDEVIDDHGESTNDTPSDGNSVPDDSPDTVPPKNGLKRISWCGEIPPQKWMTFYKKVLTKFTSEENLNLSVQFEVISENGIQEHVIDETRQALRELGLNENLK